VVIDNIPLCLLFILNDATLQIVVGDAVYIKGMPSIVYHVMAIENEDQARLMSTSTGIYQVRSDTYGIVLSTTSGSYLCSLLTGLHSTA
jgi:hypothetical protein